LNNTHNKIVDFIRTLEDLENIAEIPEAGQSYAFMAYDSILRRDIFLKLYWYSDKYKD